MSSATDLKIIIKNALPIAIGLLASNLMSLVDIAMVATLGNSAVAAVGISAFVNSVVIAFVIGVGPPIQSMVARRRGENSSEPKCAPLNSGIAVVLAIGLPLSLLCYAISPWLISLVSPDDNVNADAVPYIRAIFIAVIGTGLNSLFRWFWGGFSNTKLYMFEIIFTNIVNLFGNYLLIHGNCGFPALGVEGAGIASAISIYIGTIIYITFTWVNLKDQGFLKIWPSFSIAVKIFKQGFPISVQQLIFYTGFVVLFWIYGQIGVGDLAAATVLIRITMFMFIIAMALGQTSSMLVSNYLGKKDLKSAYRAGWECGRICFISITAIGLPLIIFPKVFLSIFLDDKSTIEIAVVPLMLTGATTGIVGFSHIFTTTLLSLGHVKSIIISSVLLQWLFFLPGVWFMGVLLGYGISDVWIMHILYAVFLSISHTTIWMRRNWSRL